MAKVHIGTSGWHYLHWKGRYYPKDLPTRAFLEHYTQDFSTVEINNTFYRLPALATLKNWKDSVPRDFLFSVKMSRYITHNKKLRDPKISLKKFFSRIEHLKPQLGPILIQLPPNWNLNLERLEEFCKHLPKGYRYAFEFRNPTWLTDDVYTLLKKKKHALCLYEFEGIKVDPIATAPFVYIRLHGSKKEAYTGNYSQSALDKWAKRIKSWKRKGIEVYCYFDNDEKGYAPQNALTLKKKIK